MQNTDSNRFLRMSFGPVVRDRRSADISRALLGGLELFHHLVGAISTTWPSMPAVLRPALTSVTRRTATSVFARERSINFCKLRTRLRSPACDAAKILCHKRRTSSSAVRQSMAYQSRMSSSGPFTITAHSPTEVGSCTDHVAGRNRRASTQLM